MELEVNSGRAILEVAASSLTYHEIKSTDELDNWKYHFVGIDIDLINNHAPKNDIIAKMQLGLSERGKEVQKEKNPRVHVLKCCYEIVRRLDFLIHGKINNETGVRYAYGNPIVEMLCEFFDYKLILEDTMKDRGDLVTTSSQSKARLTI